MFSRFTNTLRRFDRDTSGATAIEYGLIVAAIAVAIGLVVFALGGSIADLFTQVSAFLDS